MDNRITLGDRVKDPITGLVGIAVVRSEWLHGCVRIGVQAEGLDKDGKPQDPSHFDEVGLTVVEAGARTPQRYNAPRPPGGPDRGEIAGARVDVSR